MIMDVINQEQLNNSNITVTGKGSVATLKNVLADKRLTYLQGNGYTKQDGTPTPNNPIEIDGNGDNGYFDGELLKGQYAYSDGSYSNVENAVCSKNYIDCKPNDVIGFSYEEITTIVCLFYKDGTHVSSQTFSNVNTLEVTVPSNANGFKFDVVKAGITPSTAKHICVTINGMYAVRVKTVNNNITSISNLGTKWELTDKGIKNLARNVGERVTQLKLYTGKLYNISCNVLSLPTSNTTFSAYIDGVNLAGYDFINIQNFSVGVKKTFTITPDKDCELTYVLWGNANDDTFEFQLWCNEDEVKEYEPYTETQALIPISAPLYDGDYIEVYADGSGQIVRENGSYTANNASGWNVENTVTSRTRLRNNTVVAGKAICSAKAWDTTIGKCNQLISATPLNTWNGDIDNCFAIDVNGFLYVYSSSLQTIESFTTQVTNNPMTFLYKLATPITEPLTAEQVAEFKKLQTFKGVTHVTADGVAKLVVTDYQNNDEGKVVNSLMNGVSNLENTINERIDSLTDNTNTINENLSNLEDKVTNKIKIDLVQYNESVTINANSYITVNLPFSSTPYKHTILGILQVTTYNSNIIGEVGYIGDDYIQVKLHNLTSAEITIANGVSVKFSAWKRNV